MTRSRSCRTRCDLHTKGIKQWYHAFDDELNSEWTKESASLAAHKQGRQQEEKKSSAYGSVKQSKQRLPSSRSMQMLYVLTTSPSLLMLPPSKRPDPLYKHVWVGDMDHECDQSPTPWLLLRSNGVASHANPIYHRWSSKGSNTRARFNTQQSQMSRKFTTSILGTIHLRQSWIRNTISPFGASLGRRESRFHD